MIDEDKTEYFIRTINICHSCYIIVNNANTFAIKTIANTTSAIKTIANLLPLHRLHALVVERLIRIRMRWMASNMVSCCAPVIIGLGEMSWCCCC